jgi:hypothetical protein
MALNTASYAFRTASAPTLEGLFADCFKFRNKIGLDVAIEALKDCLRQKKANVNEIYRYAKICRVSNVIRPYMEAL